MQKSFKLAIILVAGFAFIAAGMVHADAAGRKGSKRVHSTAKGSHYVGGEKSEKPKKPPKKSE